MSRSTLLFIFFLGLCALLLGYNYYVQPFKDLFNPEPAAQVEVEPEDTLSAADQLLTQLSTTEKVWQVLAVPYTVSASPSASLEDIVARKPGMITLFGDRIGTESAMAVREQIAAGDRGERRDQLPIWLAVDHEGGRVQRLSGPGFTRVPSWQELCQLEPDTRQIILEKTATELSVAGIDLIFAPMVDVASGSAVLGNRVCSDDPAEVISASQQVVTLFTDQGILPVIKHFPGIGSTTRDLHTTFDRVTVTEDDALIYRQLLTQFPRLGVMTAHVGVVNQYPDLPCSLSPACVGELQNNFPAALIFTDALEMKAAAYTASGTPKNLESISTEAITAGNNVLVYGSGVTLSELSTIAKTLEARAATDSAFLNRINNSVRKIIEYKTTRVGE
ncbi:MAG TPA: glycoside hydrolase family 3 N-terminal domain-containing protein [Patescibacteria group bacterium]